MAEDPGIDQETFDRLVAEGQPERVARAKAKAAAARKARDAEAPAAEAPAAGAEAPAGGASSDGGHAEGDAGETPDQVQERVFNELVAQGEPERVARAKAKAAAARAKRTEESKPAEPAKQPVAASARASGGTAAAGASAPTGNGHGNGAVLTPEQRQARVAAALAARADGAPHERTGGAETKYAGQEHTHRLLAMVPPTGIQQIRGKQDDKAYTWPHLITAEFICLMALTAFLTIFSALAPAPLRELANPNVTPNPSKAPWYFLGLQEMLRYWHPMISGVTIPLIWGPAGLVALPYLDRNPSMRPEKRRFAYMLFTMFLVGSSVLTIFGSFFRGPGFNWTWPWTDGIWFTL